MIKIEIANEHKQERPERVVRFEFRRHAQAATTRSVEQLAYLVASEPLYGDGSKLYPIKVDGITKEFTVRRGDLEKLGFHLRVVD